VSNEKIQKAGALSLIACKCPRCGKGRVFKYSILNPAKFSEAHDHCPSCNLPYEPETGFFYGAMYWSYAIIVGMAVTLAVALWYLGWFDYAMVIIPVSILVMLPVVFRYSRMLMLFVVYPIMYKEIFSGKAKAYTE
jgi:uncharacterized protein (DUF983 family)